MRETVKTRTGRILVIPTDEEDALVTEAALADPDAQPFTDEEMEAAIPFLIRGFPYGVKKFKVDQ